MWRFVEDVSVADIAFEATGADLAELLRDAGQAVAATMVRDLGTIVPVEERRLRLEARDPERLLHKFLQEIVYYKDAELLLLSTFEAKVEEGASRCRAEVVARGEKLDPARHEQVVDVKAVTWHRFRVTKGIHGWEALVVLDI